MFIEATENPNDNGEIENRNIHDSIGDPPALYKL